MIVRQIGRTLAVIICAITLTACTLFPHLQHQANIEVQPVSYLNPDVDGKASPVVLTIYQLRQPTTFDHASFYMLQRNDNTILGNDLIDKQVIEVQPNEPQNFSISLASNTRYLGIMTAYRNMKRSNWRQTIALRPPFKKTFIDISLESHSMQAKVINIRRFW